MADRGNGRVISQTSDRDSRSLPNAPVAKLRLNSGNKNPRYNRKTTHRENTAGGELSSRRRFIWGEFSITG